MASFSGSKYLFGSKDEFFLVLWLGGLPFILTIDTEGKEGEELLENLATSLWRENSVEELIFLG